MRTTPVIRRALTAAAVAGCLAVASACSIPGPEAEIDAAFGDAAPEAHAIARCESGMNPGAVSRSNDHGLFQINAVHRGRFSDVTGQPWEAVYDAHWNTVYARYLYDQQGWRPWTCRRVL